MPQPANAPILQAHSYRADAERAIGELGAIAQEFTATGIWLHVGEWFDWPDWLRTGTQIGGSGPLPIEITVADDLLIAANVFSHIEPDELLRRFLERSRPAFGPMTAFMLLQYPNLNELLLYLARNFNAKNPHLAPELTRTNDEVHVSIDFAIPLGKLGDMLGLLALTAIYQAIQPLAHGKLPEVTLRATWPKKELAASTWSEFRCQIEPDSAINRLSMPKAMASLRNPDFSPQFRDIRAQLFATAEEESDEAQFARRIRVRVTRMLLISGQAPRLKQIAKEEGLSDRTVIRLLKREGTTFHSIVEKVKRETAARLIADANITLEAIGQTLGFTDQSSFGRSFRKWFGMPPGEYRKTVSVSGDSTVSAA